MTGVLFQLTGQTPDTRDVTVFNCMRHSTMRRPGQWHGPAPGNVFSSRLDGRQVRPVTATCQPTDCTVRFTLERAEMTVMVLIHFYSREILPTPIHFRSYTSFSPFSATAVIPYVRYIKCVQQSVFTAHHFPSTAARRVLHSLPQASRVPEMCGS